MSSLSPVSTWCFQRTFPLAVSFVALLSSSCAHEPRVVTWDEAKPPLASAPRPRAEETTTANARAVHERPVIDLTAPAGPRIDRALVEFNARRVHNAKLPPSSSAHGEAWLEVLARIDEAVQASPRGDDLGAFVRARVTLDVELETDRQRKRALPEDLSARIRRTLASMDHRVDELRAMGAAGTLKPGPRITEGDLILHEPLMPMVVTSPFGVRQDPIHGGRRFHAGVDVGAPEGTPVFASAAGVVVYAGWQGGYGLHVVLDHGEGVRTHYSHLDEIFVRVGQLVERREVVATVGSSGRATGPHLHFAVTDAEGRFIDPLSVLFTPFPVNDVSRGAPPVSRAGDNEPAQLVAVSSR